MDDEPNAGDEWWVGHYHGFTQHKPSPVCLPDPTFARAYREGYVAGKRERAGKPVTAELELTDGADVPL
jgi:hypothetical protein